MYHTASKRVRWCLLLLCARLAWGALLEDVAAAPPVKMSPLDYKEVATLSAEGRKPATGSISLAQAGKTLFAVLSVEFKDAGACKNYTPPEGAWVFHRSGRFANLFADVTRKGVLADIEKDDSIRWIDMEKMVRVPPPPREKDTGEKSRALGERIVRGGIDGLKGKGVVIAIIDSGVDFRHKDFVTLDKEGKPTSRLLHFWDTLSQPAGGDSLGGKAPYSYPNGASIGVLYTRADMTADLRAGKPRIAVTDTNGHGTACASIAAGNGGALSDKKYIGVAPEADIIAVRIGSGPGLENAYLLNAICSWLDQVCGDRPLVVSCSFGGQYGGHDGCRVAERQLDEQFALTRKGRAICIAAGNEAALPEHALIRCEGAKSPGLAAFVGTGGLITIYADTTDPDDLAVKVIGYPGARVVSRFLHPLSHSAVIMVSLPEDFTDELLGGELELYSRSGKAIESHAYSRGLAGFIGRARARSFMIATPGAAANAITVGSYDFNARFAAKERAMVLGFRGKPLTLGGISVYSNPGYSRMGKIVKPDIVAPGQYHTASLSSAVRDILRDSSGVYQPFNGTSAATPYTAGVIALLLERKPDLTLGEIKELLKQHATADIHTGRTPNPNWGYGKLDYAAVEAMVKAVKKKE